MKQARGSSSATPARDDESGARAIATRSDVAGESRIRPRARPLRISLAIPDADSRTHICRRWSEACEALETRVRDAQFRSMLLSGDAPCAKVDAWLADMASVRESLHDLTIHALDPRGDPWVCAGSPLVAYVNAALVWAGDVVGDLHEVVRELQAWTWRSTATSPPFIDDSSAYVHRFLVPRYRQLNEVCGTTNRLTNIRPCIERLQTHIVSLNWAMGGRNP